MRDEYDPTQDWTLQICDPWDREPPPERRPRPRHRMWVIAGGAVGAAVIVGLIGLHRPTAPATSELDFASGAPAVEVGDADETGAKRLSSSLALVRH